MKVSLLAVLSLILTLSNGFPAEVKLQKDQKIAILTGSKLSGQKPYFSRLLPQEAPEVSLHANQFIFIDRRSPQEILESLDERVLSKNVKIAFFCPSNSGEVALKGQDDVPESYKQTIETILDKLKEQGIQTVLVTSLWHHSRIDQAGNQEARIYNEFLRKLAVERSLTLVDYAQALTEAPLKYGIAFDANPVANALVHVIYTELILKELGADQEARDAFVQKRLNAPEQIELREILSFNDYEVVKQKAHAGGVSPAKFVAELATKNVCGEK